MIPLLVITALGTGLAAEAGQLGVQAEARPGIVLNVSEVNVLLTVTDRKGKFVAGLKNEFEVTEDSRPQKVAGVLHASQVPLRIALMMDASNSVRERFQFVREITVDLVRKVIRPRIDSALLVSFDIRVDDVAASSDDPEQLVRTINSLHPGGGTRLYDAIYLTSRDKFPRGESGHQSRRAIIVISDGEDTQSYYTRDQAVRMAHQSGVVIYTISTDAATTETHGDRVLRYLAEETGGLAFFPLKNDGRSRTLARLASELQNQYSLYYRPDPPKTDGKYHRINVRVKGRKDLTIRARKGYFAPKS